MPEIPGSVEVFFERYNALLETTLLTHQVFADLEPEFHPLKPANINPPAVYNWIQPSPARIMDTSMRLRDELHFVTRIATGGVTPAEQMLRWVQFCDAYREVMDPELFRTSPKPLN